MAPQKNSAQSEVFAKFMEKHPDIARGFSKGDKIKQSQLWNDLANQLNACGPPTRDVATWKKTWCDWRRSIKTRLAENKTSINKTGGGVFSQHYLSPVEEQLAITCNIFHAVDGVPMAKTFGTNQQIIAPQSAEDGECVEVMDPLLSLSEEPESTATISPKRKRRRLESDVANIIGEEKENFKYLAAKLEEINETMKTNTKYLKNFSRSMDELRSIKKKELEEIKRHNMALEKIAISRNEMKLEFLKLEKMKMGIPEN